MKALDRIKNELKEEKSDKILSAPEFVLVLIAIASLNQLHTSFVHKWKLFKLIQSYLGLLFKVESITGRVVGLRNTDATVLTGIRLTTPTLPSIVSGDLNIDVWVAFFWKLSHSFWRNLWLNS